MATFDSDDLGEVIFIIVICAVIAALLIVAVCCICRMMRRQREWVETSIPGAGVIPIPQPGTYEGPLTVKLLAEGVEWPILVRALDVSPLANGGNFPPAASTADQKDHPHHHQFTPQELGTQGYMLYRDPLYFDVPGTYEVSTYSADEESSTRTRIHTWIYTIRPPQMHSPTFVLPRESDDDDESSDYGHLKYEVLAPTITPGRGEVTDRTHISIASTTDMQNRGLAVTGGGHSLLNYTLKYSLDGSYPYLQYTGPFTIPMDAGGSIEKHSHPGALSGGGMRDVRIKAIAIDGNSTSRITEVNLRVVSARCITFDGSIKAPVADIDALNPGLYFDHPKKRCLIYYYVVPMVEMRRELSANNRSPHSGVTNSRGRSNSSSVKARTGIQYDNRIVSLTSEVGEIVTWAVDPNHPTYKSARRVYNVGRQSWSTEDDGTVDGASKKKNGKSGVVVAPDICLSCEDAKITFPEIPAAYHLRFTLDGSEPSWDGEDPNTLTLPPGGTCYPMRLTSGESPNVELLARWFHVAPNNDVRFGHPLHRVFSCQ